MGEIASILDVTESRISQLHSRVILRLRAMYSITESLNKGSENFDLPILESARRQWTTVPERGLREEISKISELSADDQLRRAAEEILGREIDRIFLFLRIFLYLNSSNIHLLWLRFVKRHSQSEVADILRIKTTEYRRREKEVFKKLFKEK